MISLKGTHMDFEQATAYALNRLQTELPSDLYYHGVHHTRDDVVPAVESIARNYPLSKEERALLLTGAWYHDIGFVKRYERNESLSVEIVYEVLPRYGYSPIQIEIIVGIIQATRPPQKPTSLLEEIMVDADLDSLGRTDFLTVASTLRREEEVHMNRVMTDTEWYRMEMKFFSSHRYFTAAQRYRRTSGKLKNFMKLYRCMVQAQGSDS